MEEMSVFFRSLFSRAAKLLKMNNSTLPKASAQQSGASRKKSTESEDAQETKNFAANECGETSIQSIHGEFDFSLWNEATAC